MANNTMDAIKKKMQAMKIEKDNAFDKADQLEGKLNEQKLVFEKVTDLYRMNTYEMSKYTSHHHHHAMNKYTAIRNSATSYVWSW